MGWIKILLIGILMMAGFMALTSAIIAAAPYIAMLAVITLVVTILLKGIRDKPP